MYFLNWLSNKHPTARCQLPYKLTDKQSVLCCFSTDTMIVADCGNAHISYFAKQQGQAWKLFIFNICFNSICYSHQKLTAQKVDKCFSVYLFMKILLTNMFKRLQEEEHTFSFAKKRWLLLLSGPIPAWVFHLKVAECLEMFANH